jgi:hypothetical protein
MNDQRAQRHDRNVRWRANGQKGGPESRIALLATMTGATSGDSLAREQPVHDDDEREHQQDVNQPASDMDHEEAKRPADEENDRNREEHGVTLE